MIGNIYHIPYYKFKYGSRVIIYGAGKVGLSYLRRMTYNKRLTVAAVVDKKESNEKTIYGVPVYRPNQLLLLDYDYIIVAIENEAIKNEICSTLFDLGIDSNKIIWFGDFEYMDKTLDYTGYEIDKFFVRNIGFEASKAVVFMLPEHGNIGDYLIGYAEQQFFKTFFPTIRVIGVTSAEWREAGERIIDIISDNDLICINGGGYIGDLYSDFNTTRDIIEAFSPNPKIFFPNTLTYTQMPSSRNAEYMHDVKWFSDQKNLLVLFRDELSYDLYTEANLNTRHFPDMALFTKIQCLNTRKEKIVVLCFRSDCEKVFSDNQIIKSQLLAAGYDVVEMDMYQRKYVSQDDGKREIDNIVALFQRSLCVFTDRLHGMIMSVISDTPCVAFDNTTRKISGVYPWVEDYALLASNDDEIDAVMLMKNAIRKKKNVGEWMIPRGEFEKMSECIGFFWKQGLSVDHR